jgi:hypothetical protein
MVVQRTHLGLLKPPPEVLEEMEKDFATMPIQPGPEYRRAILNMCTLNYYFPSNWVAYRETDEGPDVKAVLPDTLDYFRNITPEEAEEVIFRGTDIWHG